MSGRFIVESLRVTPTAKGTTPILHELSLDVAPGEIVGLIGESGSGKTMASLAMLDLLPPGVAATGGTIGFEGSPRDVTRRGADNDPTLRRELAAIFQNPRESLNPTMRVGQQVVRALLARGGTTRGAATDQAIALLRRCGVPGADNVMRMFPHQLSGGMCQRVMIAMAIGARPALLIADEPTTALDMTIQAQIIQLLREVVADTGCGVLLITHDLGVVAELCDRVVVLLGGRVMEKATITDLIDNPLHPYTKFLIDPVHTPGTGEAFVVGSGACPFIGRCPSARAECAIAPPPKTLADGRTVACVLFEDAA